VITETGVITDYRDPAYWRQAKPTRDWPDPPPPETVSTAPAPPGVPEVPRTVLALQRAAEGAGWAVRVGFSRAQERAVRVGTYKTTEAWGVWVGVHPVTGWRFSAIHTRTVGSSTGWGWRNTSIWSPRFTYATITDLLEFISVRGDVGTAWFKAVHARVEDQKEQQKLKAKERPKATKEGSS
jgi:hypothetical protein